MTELWFALSVFLGFEAAWMIVTGLWCLWHDCSRVQRRLDFYVGRSA
jgi:hypothetical protein